MIWVHVGSSHNNNKVTLLYKQTILSIEMVTIIMLVAIGR